MNFGMIIQSGLMGIIMGVSASATAIITTSVLVSAILTPIVTMWAEKRAGKDCFLV